MIISEWVEKRICSFTYAMINPICTIISKIFFVSGGSAPWNPQLLRICPYALSHHNSDSFGYSIYDVLSSECVSGFLTMFWMAFFPRREKTAIATHHGHKSMMHYICPLFCECEVASLRWFNVQCLQGVSKLIIAWILNECQRDSSKSWRLKQPQLLYLQSNTASTLIIPLARQKQWFQHKNLPTRLSVAGHVLIMWLKSVSHSEFSYPNPKQKNNFNSCFYQ